MKNTHHFLWLLLVAALAIPGIATGQKAKITLDDLFKKGTFRSRSVYGLTSMNDGEHYSAYNAKQQVAKFKYATGDEVSVLFNPSEFMSNADLKEFGGYQLSPTEDKMLIETQIQYIYRHSYTSNSYIFDLKTQALTPLSKNGAQMNATFSPDGKRISFVRDNNIYIVDLSTLEETQITTDGLYNNIINGAADWVYEEEFALTNGMQWSPDSKKLAFFRFDESKVKMFNMTMFEGKLYPENYTFKYPKAGETNSVVSIHTYDLESKKTTTMDVGSETDQYIARIFWTTNPNQLSMIRLNRLQNKLDIMLADATSGKSSILYTETNKYYIEEPNDNYLTFIPDGKSFIITSEQDGYKHIYLYGMDGKLIRQLTKGTHEVSAIYGYDSDKKNIYYQAYDNSPLRKAVYCLPLNGGKATKLSEQEGTNSANFSTGFKYYIHFHNNINTPTLVTLHNSKGKLLRTLEDNAKLKERIAEYDMPQKETFTFKTSEGVELYGYMVKPFDFSADKKYPVLMYQYSGPGSQSVQDNFKIGWDEHLSTLGYIVVCVDGRGTGGRGEAFKKMTYGQMGLYESTDQIEAAKYLQTLPYIDGNRIGIWGWSYGGYMSSLCLFKGADVFKMAIAVAPVTNWRYYDSIYTERFMGLPQDNGLGYDSNSPINHVDKLKGKLLLVHGTADDNVHVQNAIELIEKLVQSGKQFDLMMYPDKNHGIRGGNTTMHLYTKLTNYVKENL
ncbi:MAG: DPP IV N-terminal domain-containing protein [Bacteroidales bacterium]|nr:DPP IV N-terminal domain-containing protein [Bacteroidales bacterium]